MPSFEGILLTQRHEIFSRKTTLGYHTVKTRCLYHTSLTRAWIGTGSWSRQTDRQTHGQIDGRTDRITIANTRLALSYTVARKKPLYNLVTRSKFAKRTRESWTTVSNVGSDRSRNTPVIYYRAMCGQTFSLYIYYMQICPQTEIEDRHLLIHETLKKNLIYLFSAVIITFEKDWWRVTKPESNISFTSRRGLASYSIRSETFARFCSEPRSVNCDWHMHVG